MSSKVECMNCGRSIKGINAAKNDGWLVENGQIFCCCVCKTEYSKRKAKKK